MRIGYLSTGRVLERHSTTLMYTTDRKGREEERGIRDKWIT